MNRSTKPSALQRESTEAEVGEALAALRRFPVKLTKLDYRQRNEFHVLLYTVLWDADPSPRRILVTRDYARYEAVFGALCREWAAPPRKPAAQASLAGKGERRSKRK